MIGVVTAVSLEAPRNENSLGFYRASFPILNDTLELPLRRFRSTRNGIQFGQNGINKGLHLHLQTAST